MIVPSHPISNPKLYDFFLSKALQLAEKQFAAYLYAVAIAMCDYKKQAAHAVNCMLTARNWFIGFYIVEFEQHGADRAQYGEQLLKTLAKRINRKGMSDRRLREYRQFYRTYPYIGQEIVSYLRPQVENILQPAIAKLPDSKNSKLRPLTAKSSSTTEIWRSATAKFDPMPLEPWQTTPDRIFHRLSATHLLMLSTIEDSLKRAYYEQETIRGCWTIKELDRQISSLYYERSALSKDKAALKRYIQQTAEPMETRHILRDPMTLEFLDLPEADVYTETKLETAILDKIEHFLMELGQGFCFEHRQKRILIPSTSSGQAQKHNNNGIHIYTSIVQQSVLRWNYSQFAA